MKPVLLTLFSILTVIFVESCYYDKEQLLYPDNFICDTLSTTAKFSIDVLPVMNGSCNVSGCHNSIDAASGVILDTYTGVKTQALNGRLMTSIGSTGSMPKNAAKLSSCIQAKIRQWINSNAPNN